MRPITCPKRVNGDASTHKKSGAKYNPITVIISSGKITERKQIFITKFRVVLHKITESDVHVHWFYQE